MAQHIQIIKANEQGEEIERSNTNFAPINKALYQINRYKKKYPWISSIDEYGNTSFNYLQVPYLITELEHFQKEDAAKELIKEIKIILSFIQKISKFEHVKFIGD